MGHINRSWRISTTPNTTKFFLIIFKLIQQSIMVILSCLARKNQNLNSRKKTSVYYWELHFQGRNACKLPFLVINWTFFPWIQILSFLCKTTQNAHNSLLYKFENYQKKFVALGVVAMRQFLLSNFDRYLWRIQWLWAIIKDKEGQTAFHMACGFCHHNVAKMFMFSNCEH